MKIKLTIIACSVLLTAACQSNDASTSSAEEKQTNSRYTSFSCSSGDYQQLGYEVGAGGLNVKVFDRYAGECSKQLPSTAKADYIKGFRKGITEYCSYNNGIEEAKKGKTNALNCPLELRAKFEQGILAGRAQERERERTLEELKRQKERMFTQTNTWEKKTIN